ncbi:hypothetical protein PENTCL1PPCAC_21519 [Pristionchus entomophagus]|uniref:Uncharacterized protein n=1 Tax=Pristionchus entomophagus TaxID=358040 RepID=A0AAV5TXY7_9BILA|nr:hypothetical protein PENTCL1PPCAC_21519 [Pristionchus entomophagus]
MSSGQHHETAVLSVHGHECSPRTADALSGSEREVLQVLMQRMAGDQRTGVGRLVEHHRVHRADVRADAVTDERLDDGNDLLIPAVFAENRVVLQIHNLGDAVHVPLVLLVLQHRHVPHHVYQREIGAGRLADNLHSGNVCVCILLGEAVLHDDVAVFVVESELLGSERSAFFPSS